jgi:hypothetical protein
MYKANIYRSSRKSLAQTRFAGLDSRKIPFLRRLWKVHLLLGPQARTCLTKLQVTSVRGPVPERTLQMKATPISLLPYQGLDLVGLESQIYDLFLFFSFLFFLCFSNFTKFPLWRLG